MKKIVAWFMFVLMIFSLSACVDEVDATYIETSAKGATTAPLDNMASTKPSGDIIKFTEDMILGEWSAAWRDGEVIKQFSITFENGNTVAAYQLQFNNAGYTNFPGEEGWYQAPMGVANIMGTYAISEDGILTVHYNSCAVTEVDAVETYRLNLSNGKLTMELLTTQGDYGAVSDYFGKSVIDYAKGLKGESLWTELGVDTSVN